MEDAEINHHGLDSNQQVAPQTAEKSRPCCAEAAELAILRKQLDERTAAVKEAENELVRLKHDLQIVREEKALLLARLAEVEKKMAAAARWDVVVAVLLTRRPIIAPPMSSVEEKLHRLSLQREQDRSLLCDFELKTKKDEALEARKAELIAAGKDLSELEGELSQTNAMRQDEWIKREQDLRQRLASGPPPVADSQLFNPSRLLSRRLALVVKQRFGRKDYASPWILPQAKNQQGESLRETAERCASSMLKGTTAREGFSNAPFAVYTHIYPKRLKETIGSDAKGAKMFYYCADINNGKCADIKMDENEVSEHMWLTREEIAATLRERDYKRPVLRAMIE